MPESILRYIPVSYDVLTLNRFKFELTEVELQDKYFNYGEVTALNDDIVFKLKEQAPIVTKRDDDLLMEMFFEREYNKTEVERSIYTILDFLSDLGGVQSIFISLFTLALALINYKHPDAFMASRLFKISKPNHVTKNERNFNKDDKIETAVVS